MIYELLLRRKMDHEAAKASRSGWGYRHCNTRSYAARPLCQSRVDLTQRVSFKIAGLDLDAWNKPTIENNCLSVVYYPCKNGNGCEEVLASDPVRWVVRDPSKCNLRR